MQVQRSQWHRANKYRHHGPRQRLTSIVIAVDGVWVRRHHIPHYKRSLLWWLFGYHHQERIDVMLNVTVGHSAALSIIYQDQNGNPMLTTPTPDSPPTWADAPSAPGVDTFVANADGTAALSANAPGTDSVTATVVVGGVSYTASLAVEVDAVPQVLTSIAINAVVS